MMKPENLQPALDAINAFKHLRTTYQDLCNGELNICAAVHEDGRLIRRRTVEPTDEGMQAMRSLLVEDLRLRLAGHRDNIAGWGVDVSGEEFTVPPADLHGLQDLKDHVSDDLNRNWHFEVQRLQQILFAAQRYDKGLTAAERVPTADDYNALMAIIGVDL